MAFLTLLRFESAANRLLGRSFSAIVASHWLFLIDESKSAITLSEYSSGARDLCKRHVTINTRGF